MGSNKSLYWRLLVKAELVEPKADVIIFFIVTIFESELHTALS